MFQGTASTNGGVRPPTAVDEPAPEQLDARVGVLAGQIHALTARLVDTLAEIDEVGGWQGWGYRSLAHWLSVRAGFTVRDAQRLATLATRRDRIPTLMAHAHRGGVSAGMCEAAARLSNMANEAEIAEMVRTASPSQAARVLSHYARLAPTPDDPPMPDDEPTGGGSAAEVAQEFWSASFDEDGMYRGSFCFGPTTGSLLDEAARAARAAGESEARSSSSSSLGPESGGDVTTRLSMPEVWRRMAETVLDAVNAAGRSAPAGERFAVQVTIDVHVLARILGLAMDPTIPTPVRLGERRHVVGGPVLSDRAIAAILCDATLQVLVHDSGVPLWLGTEERTATRAQRRALRERDGGCAFPGCPQTRHLDAHHVIRVVDGGRTRLENLILLCSYHHHRVVHGDGFRITTDGRQHFWFWSPGGRYVGASPGSPPPPDVGETVPHLDRLRLVEPPDPPPDLTGETCRPIGRGEALTTFGLDVYLANLLGTCSTRAA